MAEKITITVSERPEREDLIHTKVLHEEDLMPVHFRHDKLPTLEADERVASLPTSIPLAICNHGGAVEHAWEIPRRAQFYPSLRGIVAAVFQKHAIPFTDGIDIGSGPAGVMVESLLPEPLRSRFTQIDINPVCVEMNRKKHPHARVIQGSYHRLPETGFRDHAHLITGLSTLDSTFHIDRALLSIRDALKRGGIFFHLQDVVPMDYIAMQELHDMGEQQPFIFENRGETAFRCYVQSADDMMFPTELFRRRLGRIARSIPGLELLENSWYSATRILNEGEQTRFLIHGSILDSDYPEGSVPETEDIIEVEIEDPIEHASAIVTVMRKK